MEKHTFDELNTLYVEGESSDSPQFAEMRSNILMHEGSHYKKVQDRLLERLKDSRSAEAVKLKLVKNHIQVITKTYISNIISAAPGVKVLPFNENELQDKKDAELSQAVWEDCETSQNTDEKIDKWAHSFVVVGEMAAKIYWDPCKGSLKGYQQKTNETGDPLYDHPELGEVPVPHDEMGQPLAPTKSDIPVFEGELTICPLHPFNLIRAKQAETMEESPFLCERKMLSMSEAKSLIENANFTPEEKEEKLKFIKETGKGTFKIFDGSSGTYQDSKDQVLIREYYFRPCYKYPEGYFYITTETGILFEGPLPFGLFPILTSGFDDVPTSPRSKSIIKALRAPQAEINRMASMRAITQITLGDDKVITTLGGKLQKGSRWDGIREFTSNAGANSIQVLPGRSGDQFASSLAEEVGEIYKLANLEYEMAEKTMQDPFAMLYSSLSQRKKYGMYVKKFERFLCEVAKLYLRLAKRYFDDQRLVRAIGKRAAINIAEFKNIKDDGFNIKLKPMSNDIESMMGRSMQIQQILQYVGKDLPKHTIGQLIKDLPFLSSESATTDLTLDIENIESDILALDRGEYRPAEPDDDHELYISKLTNRKKQSDFALLAPQIKQMYEQKLQEHRDFSTKQAQDLKALESEFIPTGGALVTCSVHAPDPSNPGQTRQLRIPYEALMDLVNKLEAQGTGQDQLQQVDQNNQIEILKKAQALAGAHQQQSMGMPSRDASQGPPMPQSA
jgi:hypothetical protein